METVKDQVQRKLKDQIIHSGFKGIILASMRSGKCRILLESIREYWGEDRISMPSVLVLYPNMDIKHSWEAECDKIGYHPDISYCTFASIHKVENTFWDFIIIDEAHLLGEENQLPIACALSKMNNNVIFASGTYSKETMEDLQICTGLDVIVSYSTDDAIDDGIVNDFTIYIHQYQLDATTQRQFGTKKKWWSTDLRECNRLTMMISKASGQTKMFAALARMRFINSNQSLVNKVKTWIADNEEERYLLFAPDETTGLKYGLPMFNSKSKNDIPLTAFQCGLSNQLCLIKKASAGVTFPNLKTVVITSINSNGENLEQQIGRSLLTDTEKSEIHIFVSSQEFQIKWLASALTNIDKSRIIWV